MYGRTWMLLKVMSVLIMTYLSLGQVIRQQVVPVSNCFQNCRRCNRQSPSICRLPPPTSNDVRCIPLFRNDTCELTSGYLNLRLENGGTQSRNFTRWSIDRRKVCQPLIRSQEPNNQTQNRPAPGENPRPVLGPLTSTDPTITKEFDIPNRQIQLLVIKFTIIINDSRIVTTTTSQIQNQTVSTTSQGDTTTITTNTTESITTVGGISTSNFPFLLVSYSRDQQNISAALLTYNTKLENYVLTDCGYVFQYQMNVVLNNTALTGNLIQMRISYQSTNNASWNIVEFRVDFGCGNFMVSSQCNSCVAGFYQDRERLTDRLLTCGLCPPSCKTCSSPTACTTCQRFAQLQGLGGVCKYPNNFIVIQDQFNLTRGRRVQTSSNLLQNLVVSQQGRIALSVNLPRRQIYSIKLYILYTRAYISRRVDLGITFLVFKSGTRSQDFRYSETTFQTLTGIYLEDISPNNKLYLKQIFINEGFANSSIESNAIDLQITSTYTENNPQQAESTQQFYISGLYVIQYSCNNQCLQCDFNESGTCRICSSFFELTSDCQTCANGFYLQRESPQNICVKCHSSCRQCISSSRQSCRECFTGFQLGQLNYNYQCIQCIFNSKDQFQTQQTIPPSLCSQQCKRDNYIPVLITNQNCTLCINTTDLNNIQSSDICRNCFLRTELVSSRCVPSPARGYQFFGSDVEAGVIRFDQWSSDKPLVQFNCSKDYIGLYGIARGQQTQPTETIFRRTEPSLPTHNGLTVYLNLLKLDSWPTTNNNNIINIKIRLSQNRNSIVQNSLNLSNTAGANICGGAGNQMILAYTQTIEDHTSTGPFTIEIVSSFNGIFIRQVEIYLGNCQDCGRGEIAYNVQYIPRYFNNDSQSGLDLWLRFNQPVVPFNNQNMSIQKSFNFTIDKLGLNNLLQYTEVQNLLDQSNEIRYFIPLNQSFVNGTLFTNTTRGDNILAQGQIPSTSRLLVISRLDQFEVLTQIDRFDSVSTDDLFAINQLWKFFEFFGWFTLFTMIVFAFFGVGVVFEQFSILLQLQFLHIYITSTILPTNFKVPLSAMEKMENLNFFAYPHANNIQQSWVGSTMSVIVSPHIFVQYNVDILFLRSIYPLIIINLIYLVWFVILALLLRFVKGFRVSESVVVKFIRNIPRRPINYFDQIWRYQFITVVWAAFLQFYNFNGSTAFLKMVLAMTIIAFVISVLWPFFVVFYTFRKNEKINVQHFLYSYQDIFYRKITAISDTQFKFYFYILIRFARYFFFAAFIAFFIYQPIVAPVILLVVTLIELVYLFNFKVFQDKIYFTFKVIQSLLFIVVQVLLLIIFGFSSTMEIFSYINLGYALDAIFIIMIVNGIFRFIYLIWKKAMDFWSNKYDYGEQGYVTEYDQVKKLQPIPQTQRP